MEGWQKGAPAVLKFSSAGKQKYFKQFPERESWFKQNYPEHFGKSASVATTSLKKVNKAKVQKQRLAAIRHAASKRDQLKISSAAVQAMGVRRREGGEGLGGGLETNRDIISHVRGGGTIGSGGLGSLFEESEIKKNKDGKFEFDGTVYDTQEDAENAKVEKDKERENQERDITKPFVSPDSAEHVKNTTGVDIGSGKDGITYTDLMRIYQKIQNTLSNMNEETEENKNRKIGDTMVIPQIRGDVGAGAAGDNVLVWDGKGWISQREFNKRFGDLPQDRTEQRVDPISGRIEGEDYSGDPGLLGGYKYPSAEKAAREQAARDQKKGALRVHRGTDTAMDPETGYNRNPNSAALEKQMELGMGYFSGMDQQVVDPKNDEERKKNYKGMFYENNDPIKIAKDIAEKIIEEKKLQECMPMPMTMMIKSKPEDEESMEKGDTSSEAKEEPGEYDYEGDMAKSQLRSIGYNAKMLHDMLEDNTNLPEWVQSKITLAEDYILTAANYMRGELKGMNEEADMAADEDLPFEPNATRKEMPAGKQPAQYRYVRNLARKAMVAGIAAAQQPASAEELVAQHNALHTVAEQAENTDDLVPRSMLPDKSAIPAGKGFGDDIKREKIKQKVAKAVEKKRNALPIDNPSENELVPQSMLPDKPGYPDGYIVPEPVPTTIVTNETKPMKEEVVSPYVNAASKFLTRTSARLVYGEKND